MSTLIRNGRVEADDYSVLGEDDALPTDNRGSIIVPLARWLREGGELQTRFAPVGISLPNTLNVEDAWPQLQGRPLLQLVFPAFGDGRAYSQARILRERFGYAAEIRAVGAAVVCDQLHSLARVGVSSFVLRADQDVDNCLAAMRSFHSAYQPATPTLPLPIVQKLRRESRHVAAG